MKSACVGVLSIIELKNARWNIEIRKWFHISFFETFDDILSHALSVCLRLFSERGHIPT